MEIWKDVPGFCGYQVSNYGNARSIKYGEWRSLFPNRSGKDRGYIVYHLRLNGKTLPRAGHRLVWEAFNGAIGQKKEINHINGIKSDNALSNLECVSTAENMRHCFVNGLRKKTNKGKPPLSLEDVAAIRFFYISGKKGHSKILGKIFNRQEQTIRLIGTKYISGYFPL